MSTTAGFCTLRPRAPLAASESSSPPPPRSISFVTVSSTSSLVDLFLWRKASSISPTISSPPNPLISPRPPKLFKEEWCYPDQEVDISDLTVSDCWKRLPDHIEEKNLWMWRQTIER